MIGSNLQLTASGLRMSGYTDESLNSDTRLSRASPALCSMASSWVSMGLAATLVTRTQLMVTMMGEVSMVMCTEILMLHTTPHTSFIKLRQARLLCILLPLTRCICGHRAMIPHCTQWLLPRTEQLGFSDA